MNGDVLGWDERYRLTSAVRDSVFDIQYSYDVLNRRTSRIEGGTTTNLFVYNGNQIVADLDGSGNLLRSYVWGQGIDNLLSMTTYGATATNTYHAIKDHQNTVTALTDDTGSVVESYEYDAYGNTKVFDATGLELTESAYGNRYTFQGRETDWDTGLMYFRARWYNPDTGRWLSKDPIGIHGGFNQYAFVENNPVNFIDPRGEVLQYVIGIVIVGLGMYALIRGIYKGGELADRARKNGNETKDLMERLENGEDIFDELNEANEEMKEILNETEELALDMIQERITNPGF